MRLTYSVSELNFGGVTRTQIHGLEDIQTLAAEIFLQKLKLCAPNQWAVGPRAQDK
jgi:hypothetical protein